MQQNPIHSVMASRCVSLLCGIHSIFYAYKLHLSGLKQAKVHIFDQPRWLQQVIHIPLEKKMPRSHKICLHNTFIPPGKFNIAIHSPLKMDAWKMSFLLGWFPIFRGYVQLRGGNTLVPCDHVTMTSKSNNFCWENHRIPSWLQVTGL